MLVNENYISFGNVLNINETFSIHLCYFEQFCNTIKNILSTFPEKQLKKQKIFRNEEMNCFYLWETFLLFDNIKNQHTFAVKFSIENNDEFIYQIILKKKQFYCLIDSFYHSIFLALPLENNHKLWLKHCTNLPIENLKKTI